MSFLQVEQLAEQNVGENRILVVHELLQAVAFEQMQVSPLEEQKSTEADAGRQRSGQIVGT